MNQGKILAQGTYDELSGHPYMLQVQDIHASNKEEISNANKKALSLPQLALDKEQSGQHSEINFETSSSSEHGQASNILDDAEISQKLEKFTGAISGLDKESEAIVGKLLLDERKENMTADWKTYAKLFNMAGGTLIFGLLVLSTVFFQYFDIYSISVSQEWADSSAEAQAEQYSSYMTKLALISIVGFTLRTVHAHVFDQRRRAIGRDVHKETLQRILLAPVNKFFDVTPIGKIMQIFTEDLNVFYGRILDAPKEIFDLLC